MSIIFVIVFDPELRPKGSLALSPEGYDCLRPWAQTEGSSAEV